MTLWRTIWVNPDAMSRDPLSGWQVQAVLLGDRESGLQEHWGIIKAPALELAPLSPAAIRKAELMLGAQPGRIGVTGPLTTTLRDELKKTDNSSNSASLSLCLALWQLALGDAAPEPSRLILATGHVTGPQREDCPVRSIEHLAAKTLAVALWAASEGINEVTLLAPACNVASLRDSELGDNEHGSRSELVDQRIECFDGDYDLELLPLVLVNSGQQKLQLQLWPEDPAEKSLLVTVTVVPVSSVQEALEAMGWPVRMLPPPPPPPPLRLRSLLPLLLLLLLRPVHADPELPEPAPLVEVAVDVTEPEDEQSPDVPMPTDESIDEPGSQTGEPALITLPPEASPPQVCQPAGMLCDGLIAQLKTRGAALSEFSISGVVSEKRSGGVVFPSLRISRKGRGECPISQHIISSRSGLKRSESSLLSDALESCFSK